MIDLERRRTLRRRIMVSATALAALVLVVVLRGLHDSDLRSQAPQSSPPPEADPDRDRAPELTDFERELPDEPPGSHEEAATPSPSDVDAGGPAGTLPHEEEQAPEPILDEPAPEDGDGVEIAANALVVGLRELVDSSERIVLGCVTRSESRWNEDRSAIFTYYDVSVYEVLKGEVEEPVVVVRVIGGEIVEENIALHVSHQPELEKGVEGIFFLDDDPDLWTGLSGAAQGFLAFDRNGPDETFLRDGFDRPILNLTDSDRFQVRGEVAQRITSREVRDRILDLAR